MERVRFLSKKEYKDTERLARLCFGEEDFDEEYYGKDIYNNLVAVKETDAGIVSMAHLSGMRLELEGGKSARACYVLYVATDPRERHKGYMDEVMSFCTERLRDRGVELMFLVPVDPEIYTHLGFTHEWRFNEDERELLYADEGLCSCYGKNLNGGGFEPPERIVPDSSVL